MIIQFSNVASCQCNTGSINNVLNHVRPILFRDIRIVDLCINQGNPIDTGHGVYLFYDNQNLLYVGSCSSQLFLHRIPSHCDHRPPSGFSQNTFLQQLVGSAQYQGITTLQQAQTYIFSHISVKLINFSQSDVNSHNIRKFENLLRQILNPMLNGGCSFGCYSNISTLNVGAVV